jgi:hypothetical protein
MRYLWIFTDGPLVLSFVYERSLEGIYDDAVCDSKGGEVEYLMSLW